MLECYLEHIFRGNWGRGLADPVRMELSKSIRPVLAFEFVFLVAMKFLEVDPRVKATRIFKTIEFVFVVWILIIQLIIIIRVEKEVIQVLGSFVAWKSLDLVSDLH